MQVLDYGMYNAFKQSLKKCLLLFLTIFLKLLLPVLKKFEVNAQKTVI